MKLLDDSKMFTMTGFQTMSNPALNLVGLTFQTDEGDYILKLTPSVAKELIDGLKKSLKRLKERQT